jgi:Stigma-specific protein, Stig1
MKPCKLVLVLCLALAVVFSSACSDDVAPPLADLAADAGIDAPADDLEVDAPAGDATADAPVPCGEASTGITCGGKCVDPLTNPAHCGGCDKACNTGEACVGGICQASCPPGTTFCNGTCVDLQSHSITGERA